MRPALVFLVLLSLTSRGTRAAECLEPTTRVVSRWKNGNYYKGEIDSITNRVNVLFDNGARLAYNPRDNVDIVVDRIPDHNELPWGSQILVNRPRSRAFEIGYIRDIKNGRFVILYENGDQILHTLDQLRTFNKSRICDEPAYLGCFRDNLPRDLQVYIPTHPATIGACVDTCKSQGFSIGALRNSDLCFCGNSYSKSNQVREKDCDMPCYDNSYEICGGFMTFSQYWTGIVDSAIGAQPIPGLQKHFIPSNHPIPWELLVHARSKHLSRYGMAGSARSAAWYQAYPWKGNNVAPFQPQRTSGLSNYPSTYHGKTPYSPSAYQRYQQYYGTKPYPLSYNGHQLQQNPRYNYQSAAANSQTTAYGAYQRQASRWPYNYNYYKYRNYNTQSSVTNRPYNGYQSVYQRKQRKPAPKPSPQEQAKLMAALSAPRFMGCFQDTEARDLPTAVEVRPLTVEGCVTKCGQSGFSMAGLQSSTQCFCGTTYSKYGRLRDEHCTMRCTGNYKEICGGYMRNSIYYTGVGLAVPVDTTSDARTQKITFIKNEPLSFHANEKPQSKPKSLRFKKPLALHNKPSPLLKAAPHKTKVTPAKGKVKIAKDNAKKPVKLKHKDEGRPITIEDYGKLRKILEKLSRWQQQPHELSHDNNDLKNKPTPSYQELRKVLQDMTPEIVKNIANKIMAGERNRTRLSDMKPLKAVHSLEVNLAAAKTTKDKDIGFKRVKVNSSNYKNWSRKGESITSKVRNKNEDVILEADAKTVKSSENGVTTKENDTKETLSKNDSFSKTTQVSSRYAKQNVPKLQSVNGNKLPKLPSFIPLADKGRKHGLNSKLAIPLHSHKKQNASKQYKTLRKDIAMSDVQSNKRNFVHFVLTETKDKKTKIPKTAKLKSPRNKTQSHEIENPRGGTLSHSQEKSVPSGKNGTKENGTSHENQTNVQAVTSSVNSSVPTDEIVEVFDVTPANNTFVGKDQTNPKKNVKDSKTVTKTINLEHKRIPHKVLHVEAKWNGQIKVKANWKDLYETEPETKPKKTASVKKTKVKPKKKTAKLKSEENSGEEEGNDEYKFDDSGSRNDLMWRDNRPLKEKSE